MTADHAEAKRQLTEAYQTINAHDRLAVRVSVLEGHLSTLRKVLFFDAATDHETRYRKAWALLEQATKGQEAFVNAFAALRAERDTLAAEVERLRASLRPERAEAPYHTPNERTA